MFVCLGVFELFTVVVFLCFVGFGYWFVWVFGDWFVFLSGLI